MILVPKLICQTPVDFEMKIHAFPEICSLGGLVMTR
jgi:hypothetical protein